MKGHLLGVIHQYWLIQILKKKTLCFFLQSICAKQALITFVFKFILARVFLSELLLAPREFYPLSSGLAQLASRSQAARGYFDGTEGRRN